MNSRSLVPLLFLFGIHSVPQKWVPSSLSANRLLQQFFQLQLLLFNAFFQFFFLASATYQEDNKPQVSLLDTLATAITDQYDNKSKCIDHYNKPYVRLLKRNLHSAPADLIARNIVSHSFRFYETLLSRDALKNFLVTIVFFYWTAEENIYF